MTTRMRDWKITAKVLDKVSRDANPISKDSLTRTVKYIIEELFKRLCKLR